MTDSRLAGRRDVVKGDILGAHAAPSYLSVRLSVCPHGTTRLLQDGFSMKLDA